MAGVVNALPVEATSVVFNSNATFVSSNVKGDPLISGPQHKDVKVEEFGEAGLVIDFGGRVLYRGVPRCPCSDL
ncbi:hypothetical protein BFU36_12075 [Sulfolobus sp. A20]|nr:hypothetical protein BFU36_12075 [Sulfolobus sp. A20]